MCPTRLPHISTWGLLKACLLRKRLQDVDPAVKPGTWERGNTPCCFCEVSGGLPVAGDRVSSLTPLLARCSSPTSSLPSLQLVLGSKEAGEWACRNLIVWHYEINEHAAEREQLLMFSGSVPWMGTCAGCSSHVTLYHLPYSQC